MFNKRPIYIICMLLILNYNKHNVLLVTSFKSIMIPTRTSSSLSAFSGQHATDSYYKQPFDHQAPKVPHDSTTKNKEPHATDSYYKTPFENEAPKVTKSSAQNIEPLATDTFSKTPFNSPNNCHNYQIGSNAKQIVSADNFGIKNIKQNYNFDKKQQAKDTKEWSSYVMVDDQKFTAPSSIKSEETKGQQDQKKKESNDTKAKMNDNEKEQQQQQVLKNTDNRDKRNEEFSSYVMADTNKKQQKQIEERKWKHQRDNKWDNYIKGKKISFTNSQRSQLLEKAKNQERTIYPGSRFESPNTFEIGGNTSNSSFRSIAFRRSGSGSRSGIMDKKENRRLEDTRKNNRINDNLDYTNIDNDENQGNNNKTGDDKADDDNGDTVIENTDMEEKEQQTVNTNNNEVERKVSPDDERFDDVTEMNAKDNYDDLSFQATNSFGRRRRRSDKQSLSFNARRNSQLVDTNENYFKDSFVREYDVMGRRSRRSTDQQQGNYRIDDGTILRDKMNQRFIDSNGSQTLSSSKEQQQRQRVITKQQQRMPNRRSAVTTDLETRLESISDNKSSSTQQRDIYDDDNYTKDLEKDVLKSLSYDDEDDDTKIDASNDSGTSSSIETAEENDKIKRLEDRMHQMESRFNELLDKMQ